MCRRPAKIGEHTVAQILADHAAIIFNDAGYGVLIAFEEISHILGVEAHGQCRRSNQIDEHHRQLPMLATR